MHAIMASERKWRQKIELIFKCFDMSRVLHTKFLGLPVPKSVATDEEHSSDSEKDRFCLDSDQESSDQEELQPPQDVLDEPQPGPSSTTTSTRAQASSI